jgi:5-methylcytosine-specific restriction protein B
MVFEPRAGIFKRLCDKATDNSTRNYYLIVDEFKRGDVPRIFGELITTIEHDKRGRPILLPQQTVPFPSSTQRYADGSALWSSCPTARSWVGVPLARYHWAPGSMH